MISTACPHCNRKLQAPEKLLGLQVKCPSCKGTFTVATQVAAIAAAPTSPFPSFERPPSKGWRFLSLPWLITILLFGFLPWCEISCHKTEIRLTQSGYQAIYGDVSLPPAVDDALVKQAERNSLDLEATRKQLGFERSYLANVSPFLIFFWVACVCLIVIICSTPLGGLRLGFTLPLAGVMLVTLVVHAASGLPLERRFGLVMGELLRKDAESMLAIAAFTVGKTVWFWLILACVGLLGISESLLNWLRAECLLRWKLPAILGGTGFVFALSGVVIQFAVREAIVSNVESRIAQAQKAEQEKKQRADAEYRRQQEARWAAAKQQRAEAERLRQQAAVKAEEGRLEELRHRREQQRMEREERAAEARRREEREREERQQQEEARARAEEEARVRREAQARQARIDREEVQAKKLLKAALQLKARGGFKKQVQEKLQEIIDKYPDTPSAEKAKQVMDKL